MKFGCEICIFLNSEKKKRYVELRRSLSVSEGPFNFEITIVDCNFYFPPLYLILAVYLPISVVSNNWPVCFIAKIPRKCHNNFINFLDNIANVSIWH